MSGVKYFLIDDFESMELMGVKGLFTRLRVDEKSLPNGFYKYTIREERGYGYSPRRRDSRLNRVGDFICKGGVNLNGGDEAELPDGYRFTQEVVNLDAFFGEDVKLKVAQELEAFVYDFDTHSYQDNVPEDCSREDVVKDVRQSLDGKAYVDGVVAYFESILDEDKEQEFLPLDMRQDIRRYVTVLKKINEGNRDALDRLIDRANKTKEQPQDAGDGKSPVRRQ